MSDSTTSIKIRSCSEQSTLRDDRIMIKILEDGSKVKAVLEMDSCDAWLDEFDILVLIQELYKALNEEQQKNLEVILRKIRDV